MSKKTPKIEEILRQNPGIDKDKLRKSLELAEELRKLGRPGVGYRLASPATRRGVHVDDSDAIRRAVSL